jgi:protein O-mannosyl-transferase
VMLCLRWAVLRHDGPMEIPFVDNPISGAGWLAGRTTAVAVIGRYLWLLLWPRTLSSDYSYNQIPLLAWHSMTWQQWTAVAAVAGLLLAMAWCYRRSKTGFFLLGFSALTLLPAANLLVTTGTIMGERLLYLPAVGFACAVSFGIYSLASRLGLRPMAAAVALSAISLAYGARTYQRNPDWQDDETLFASAAEAAPASFKPHLSLAYIWYAQDPTFLQGDRAISEAEMAAAIVDGLPDGKAPAAVPVVLGTIYLARGDSLAPRDNGGNPQPGAASAEWYGKALAADLRAETEDRAFNENHRRRELQRGTPADQIAPAGLPDVYGNLGQVYLRLGDPQKAREKFLYQRRLAPAMPQAYANLSAADVALDQPEEAARMLLEAYLLERQQSTLYQLSQLYAKVASGGCAIVRQTEGRSLNQDCAIVRRDLCSAFRDLEQVFRDARLTDDSARFRDASRGVQGCQ